MSKTVTLIGFLLVACSARGFAADAGQFEERAHSIDGQEFRYLVLNPPQIEPGKKYPLVYFLHGAGERGDNPNKLLVHFPIQMAKPDWREKYPCFLVMPQCRNGKLWMNQHWGEKEFKPLDDEPNDQMAMAISILETTLQNPHIDKDRVYLTGLSMGGFGSWELAMRKPELFAAVAPVCGGGDESKAARLKDIPIWTAHGGGDRVVWPIRSRRMVEAVKKAGGNIQYTEYPGVGHNSWTRFYADPEGVVPWMFKQRRPQDR